jgi:hypothetical protein
MSENTPEVFSRLGKLEARDDAQDVTLVDVKKDVEEIKSSVRAIELQLAEKRAGTKYLIMVLTLAGMVGALIDRFISWLKLF